MTERLRSAAPTPLALAPAVLLSALALAPSASAQAASTASLAAALAADHEATVDRVIELGRTDNRAQEHLDYLTNNIGPRLTSSSNLTRSCEWAANQFRSWGLDARIERWGEFPVGFDRNGHFGGMVSPEKIDYVFRTPAWTPGTPGPVRAHALLEPKNAEELEAIRDQLPGAWLVRRSGRANRSFRQELQAAIDGAGIAGEIKKGGQRIQIFGNHRISYDELPTLVSVRLRTDQWEDLVERLEGGQEIELELDIDNRFLPGPIPLYNVVADIPGTEFPDEYVIVGGHIDSWDAATGTNDNGTGVSTTMEAARLLMAAGAKPRRTIRFMLWSGEEQGLLGSRGYVRDHPELMDKISAVLVHDKGTNYLSGITGPPALAKDLRTVFEPVTDLNPEMPFEVRENQGFSRAGGSSDHASFLAQGVPGLFWEQAGRTRYGDFWHTHHDTFDSAVPEYQEHSSMVAAIGALGIANLDHLLERTGLFRQGGRSGATSTRRRMGVFLNETEITDVTDDGMANAAGWKAEDVILSIDGVEVSSQSEVVGELQKGGPKKTFKIKRGDKVIESVLDYTGTPSEKAREEQRKREEAEKKKAEDAAKKKDAKDLE